MGDLTNNELAMLNEIVSKTTFLLFSIMIFSGCTSSQELPNVIYITMEDLSPLWGCYGNKLVKTPYLDDFANDAVLFEDVHCQVALCTPSRTSILTGIRPSTSGIVKIDDDWQQMLPGAVSLPRHFRNNGYFTYKVGKISDPRNGGMDSAWTVAKEPWGIEKNDLALTALKEVAMKNEPFFLAIGYKQTHDPWNPSKHALQKYDLNDIDIVGSGRQYNGKVLTDEEIKELLRRYYASITDVDSLVGNVIERIKQLDLYHKSVILVGVMDHGYSLGVHNKWGKGGVYDNMTRVPLTIRIPQNQHNGARASGITELVDLYPTLVDICGLPSPPQNLEGYSLKKLLNNPDLKWKEAAFSHRAYDVNIVGIKTRNYSSVHYPDGKTELFDRLNDPINLHDISENHPEIVNNHKELKETGWQNSLPKIEK